MIPYSYEIVSLNGLDLAEANHTVVEGLYHSLDTAMNACGDFVLCNWFFAAIPIAPCAVSAIKMQGYILINGAIQVTELDEVTVVGLPAPPEPVTSLIVSENGVYEPEEPYSGFNPVIANFQKVQLIVSENGTYYPEPPAFGFNPVVVDVPIVEPTYAFIVVDYTVGAICTASNGSTTITAPDTNGHVVFSIPIPVSTPDVWTITVTLGQDTKTRTVTILSYGERGYELITIGLPSVYKEVEYLEVGNAQGPYIDTGAQNTNVAFFEVTVQYTQTPGGNYGIFGAQTAAEFGINTWNNVSFARAGMSPGANFPVGEQLNKHKVKAVSDEISIDDTAAIGSVNWSAATNRNYYLFAINYSGGILKTANARIFSCKIWNGDTIVREFVPCYRISDNEPGMYDLVNDVFYANDGTGSFILGPEV